jgi:hypothetical protein
MSNGNYLTYFLVNFKTLIMAIICIFISIVRGLKQVSGVDLWREFLLLLSTLGSRGRCGRRRSLVGEELSCLGF